MCKILISVANKFEEIESKVFTFIYIDPDFHKNFMICTMCRILKTNWKCKTSFYFSFFLQSAGNCEMVFFASDALKMCQLESRL